ncbi:MAG: FlgD immunoglobulin-like domain containing protein [bacterium]
MDRGFGFLGTSRHHNKEADFTNFVNYHAAFALWVGAVTPSGERRVTSGSGNAVSRAPEWAPRPETFQIDHPADLSAVEKKTIASYEDGLEIEGHRPLGLSVEQKVYGMKDGKFAVIDFALTLANPAGELKDFYVGFWSDIDVPGDDGKDTPDNDKIEFASNNKAILVYDGETKSESLPLLGAMILGTDTPIVSWWQDDSDPKDDPQEYSYLSGENEKVPPETPGDYRFLLSYGPFGMSAGETIHFSIALTQADDLNTVESNFATAEEFYRNALGLAGLPKKPESSVVSGNIPSGNRLYPNYPNPFNPTTEIRFDLREATHVQLLIYDLASRVVRHLIDGEYQPGKHFASWDGRDDAARPLASGVYLYKLRAGNFQMQRKLVLMK